MVDALFFGLHVPVKHGGVGTKASFVGFLRGTQPHLAAGFVVADDFSHARMKYFRASAGAGVDSRFLHFVQDFFYGQLGDAREVMNFNHREGLNMHTGAALFEAADQFEVMIEGQIRMQAADDVKLRGPFANALFRALVDLLESKRVSTGRVRIAAKSAEFAMRDAYVGRVDVAIDVVVGNVSVALLTNVVREPADGQKVRRTVKRDAVIHRQALARENFLSHGL